MTRKNTIDFSLDNHGSICILHLLSNAAKDWVEDNLPEDRMTWCGGVVIEPRYVQPIVAGMIAEGLTYA